LVNQLAIFGYHPWKGKIMKKSVIIISIIVVGALAIGLIVTQTKKEPAVIKIGAILPLTGDFASFGEEIKKGMEIAREEYDNRTGLSFNIIYEDDQSLSPVSSVNAANKLIQMDKVHVGMTMLVEESRPIAPIFNKNKIPLIVLWDSNKFIKDAGEYIFSNGFSTEKAGEIMAQFAYSKLGLKRVALIKHVDPWAEIISDSFEASFKKLGGSIEYKDALQPTETDYKTVIAKIKKKDVDGVYFALVPPNSALFLIQAKELGLKSRLLTGDALIQDVINAAGRSVEGTYFTNIFTEPAKASLLSEKYKNKYKKDPLDVTLVSFGYDGVMKVVEAVKKSPNKSIWESLISIFGKERSADREEKIYQIIEGKPVEVK